MVSIVVVDGVPVPFFYFLAFAWVYLHPYPPRTHLTRQANHIEDPKHKKMRVKKNYSPAEADEVQSKLRASSFTPAPSTQPRKQSSKKPPLPGPRRLSTSDDDDDTARSVKRRLANVFSNMTPIILPTHTTYSNAHGSDTNANAVQGAFVVPVTTTPSALLPLAPIPYRPSLLPSFHGTGNTRTIPPSPANNTTIVSRLVETTFQPQELQQKPLYFRRSPRHSFPPGPP